MVNYSKRKTKSCINLPHPYRITSCKIVIYGNYMYTFTCKCIKCTR